ncbi:MAG: choice-of-anchor D domain-containing protein, partial [Taibaiella sp.]|nr:choice-of-anchor D domain-containing protein [Taibaiella sp.]
MRIEECPDEINYDTVIVIVDVVKTKLELRITDPLPPEIIQVRVNQRGTITATLKNDSEIPLEFDRLVVQSNPPFRVTSPAVPFWLQPGTVIPVEIEFAPTAPGMYSGTLTAYTSEKSGDELSCPDSVKVIFSAEGIFATITLSKSTLDFGDVLWCETKLDTFYVGNSEKSSEPFTIISDPTITGVSASHFTIEEKPAVPITLQPGETVRYIVRFTPNNGAVDVLNAELRIRTDNQVDSVLLVLLTGKRDKVHLEALPSEVIDFGDVLIESTWIPKTKIHNRSKFNTNIRLIAIQKIAGDIETTFNFTDSEINALDSIAIEPKFVFKTVTPLEIRLVFVSDYPCPDTLTLIFRANGIKGSLQSPDSVYFGMVIPCDSYGQKIYVKNTGMTTLEIQNAEIQTGEVFTFFEQPQLPITIAPGDSVYFAITFAPWGKPEGIFTDYLVLTSKIDNKQQVIEIKLFGELSIGLILNPDSLDFGNVTVGKTKSLPFEIKMTDDRELLVVKLLPAKH